MTTFRSLLPFLLTVFLSLSLSCPAFAGAPVSRPGGAVSAPFGPGGLGFPVGKLATVLNYRYIEADSFRDKNGKVAGPFKMTKNVGIAKFRYGLAPGLDIRTATPLYDIELDFNDPARSDDHKGWLGDTTVILHKVIMNQDRNAPFSLALDAGLVLPTADGGSDNIDFIGNRAWGAGIGAGLTYFLDSHRLDQEISYYTFSEGKHDYRKPDRFRVNTAYAYAFNGFFEAGAESLFEWNDESEKRDTRQDDAKHEWYVGPRVRFSYKP